MRSARAAVALVVALACATACSAATDGHGTTVPSGPRTPGSRTSHDFPSRPPATTSPARPSNSSASGRFVRTPVATAIGDPPHADLCSAISLAGYARPGYRPAFFVEQLAGACTVYLNKSDGSRVVVTVYATTALPDEATGRTRHVVAGLVVYSYPYEPDMGGCERDIVVGRITLVVAAVTPKSPNAVPDRVVNCAAVDRMTGEVAPAAAHRRFGKRDLATPSVFDLDACDIVMAAGWSKTSLLRGGEPVPDTFDAGCGSSRAA